MTSGGLVKVGEGRETPWWWSIVLLIVLLAGAVWYRAHTFAPTLIATSGVRLWPAAVGASEPLDCDEAAYAYIGHRLLQGDVMYRDLTENKPPLGYWLYALGVSLGGYNELTIRLLAIPPVLLTMALVWWLGYRLAGSIAACLAAGLFCLLSTDPYLFGNGSNLEHFMNLFSIASLAVLIQAWSRNSRWLILAAGFCLGAAALVKQVAILPAFVYLAALIFRRPNGLFKQERRGWSARVGDIIALGMGHLLVLGSVAVILLVQGAGAAAYEDIMRYGRALATDTLPEPGAPSGLVRWLTGNADPSGQLPWPFGSTSYLVWWGTGSWPLWLAAVPATAYLLVAPGSLAGRRLVAGWNIAAVAQVILPGLYWQHYYLLPTPGIAVAVATALADCVGTVIDYSRTSVVDQRSQGRARHIAFAASAGLILLVAIAATLVIQVRGYLLVPPQELTVRYKGGGQWVALRALGQEIARRCYIWRDPRLYIWGWQSPLHFYAELDGVTRHFFVDNLLRDRAERDHPLIKPRIAEIMSALRARPPALIFAGYPPFPGLRDLLHERYLPSRLVPSRNGLGLWVERDHFNLFEYFKPAGPDVTSELRRGPDSQECMIVDDVLVALPQFAHDGVPALAKRVSAGRFRHGAQPRWLGDECQDCLGEPLRGLGRLHEQPGSSGLYSISDAPGTNRCHGHSGGHRLEHHVTEGLGKAGEREEVAGRVIVCQLFPHAVTRERGDRPEFLFQSTSRWSVAHKENPHVGPPGGHHAQRVGQVRHVFLGCDPAHVADHQIIRRPAERLAHALSSRPVRTEESCVDTPGPEHHALETESFQALDGGERGNVGLARSIVEPPQVTPDRSARPADAVVPAILIEVGVKARYRNQLAAQHMPQHGQPQRRLGRDVDQVRPERVNCPANGCERGQRQIQFFIKGYTDRTDQMNVGPRRRLSIIRMNQLDHVAPIGEMADELAEGAGNAVHLGVVRFRDQGHAHKSFQAFCRAS
jgi:4-amino-4-deoxy-L-arabinose transferase-like glycosyltransferase